MTRHLDEPRHITQREMRNDSAAIFRAIEDGESFVLTRNGTPIAQVIPIRKRTFVPRDDVLRAFAHVPEIDYAQMRAEMDEFINQYPREDPWVRRDDDDE